MLSRRGFNFNRSYREVNLRPRLPAFRCDKFGLRRAPLQLSVGCLALWMPSSEIQPPSGPNSTNILLVPHSSSVHSCGLCLPCFDVHGTLTPHTPALPPTPGGSVRPCAAECIEAQEARAVLVGISLLILLASLHQDSQCSRAAPACATTVCVQLSANTK